VIHFDMLVKLWEFKEENLFTLGSLKHLNHPYLVM